MIEGDFKMDIAEAEELSVIDYFKSYATQLDARHDLHEKLVKKSRDVTQESKRIIFLLHRVENLEKGASILNSAKKRLWIVFQWIADDIGSLLILEDLFLFLKAFKPGIQEFVEAVSFYYYLAFGTLVSLAEMHKGTFLMSEKESKEINIKEINMSVLLTPSDYILGIADLTGELMRRCVASKSLEEPFFLRTILNDIYKVFKHAKLSQGRYFKRKCFTLKSSLRKVEMACYSIHVRIAEIEKIITISGTPLSLEDFQSRILESAFQSEQEKDDE